MKTDIKSLQDSFESGYALYETSRFEASLALDMFHNRQWAPEQLAELELRGQPKETFNIIKLMTRTLIGYYSNVVNKAVIEPRSYDNITKSTMLNDTLKCVYEKSEFDTVDDDIKMYGMLTGLFVSYTQVKASGEQDVFGRNEYDILIEDVNPEEIIVDAMAKKRDYSDGRFTHRFRWLPTEVIKEEFGKNDTTIKKLNEYENHLNIDAAEYTYKYEQEFVGKYKVDNMYLVVHSIVKQGSDTYSIFWCGDIILSKTKLNHKDGVNPYTIVKVQKSNKEEYYGIFREIIEPQRAVNQALIQIQLMVNSNKILVEEGAVEDVDEFADAVARVNGVAIVDDLSGIKIENMSQDVLNQYTIIDSAFSRIQKVLGINDAMLGQAMAADSGRKIKLQKNSGLMTLRYLTGPLELFHKRQAQLVVKLILQYYTAHQSLRVTDDVTGSRFIELNKPLILPKLPPELASLVAQGMPVDYAFEALLTGQLSPMVQQAFQAQEQSIIAQQEYQQMQQQSAQTYEMQKQQLIDSGKSPQHLQPPMMPPPPPQPNQVQQLPEMNLEVAAENSPMTQENKFLAHQDNLPPGLQYAFEEMLDPQTGLPAKDKDGRVLLVPQSEELTKLDVKDYDIIIKPSSYDDEDEKAQLMLEVLLNGSGGQFVMNASPAHYAKMLSLNVQSMKTKFSPEIAQMFNEIAMSLGANPQFEAYMRMVSAGIDPMAGMMGDDGNGGALPPGGMSGDGPSSKELKLPQNTNEGM